MRKLFNYFLVILCMMGFMILSYPFIRDGLIQYLSSKNYQTVEKVEVSYDFEEITPITLKDVVVAMSENLPIIGRIKVPSVGIDLPVIEGVSNTAMAVGASTMKADQVMGDGNYALVSHHMNNPNLLFSPLDRVEIGAEISLSDEETTYQYIVTEKRVIEANEVYVIEDQEGRTLVTLITCNSNGKKRLLVVGEIKFRNEKEKVK